MKTSNHRFKKTVVVLFMLSCIPGLQTKAQLAPMGVQYFQTQYLANPALAGIGEGTNLHLGYRQQWNSIPGAPVKQYLAGEFHMTNKVGLGFTLYNDAAGLLKKTSFTGSYAYHLPLNDEDQKMHFGLSFGYRHERISNEDIIGDVNDNAVVRFNQRKNYVDGDFGIAYTSNRLNIQAAFPNLKSLLKKEEIKTIDRATFFSAISYKWSFGENVNTFVLEPKFCFRGVSGYDNIADFGANLSVINNKLNFSGMYHTSKSSTFGVGFHYQSMAIFGLYSTENTQLRGDANGVFEIGLKLNLKRARQGTKQSSIDTN
jgi:type IX secretion system PorP/SprF family membrane protein